MATLIMKDGKSERRNRRSEKYIMGTDRNGSHCTVRTEFLSIPT